MTTRTHTSECAKTQVRWTENCTCGARYEPGVEQRLVEAEARAAELERRWQNAERRLVQVKQAHGTARDRADELERLLAEARTEFNHCRSAARFTFSAPWEDRGE